MGFSTTLFLFLFLPLMLGAYFVSPARGRNGVLFAGSLLFYAWGEPFYLFVLLGSLVVNYSLALRIEAASEIRRRRILLLSFGFNLGLLIGFKYSGFLLMQLGSWGETWLQIFPGLRTPHLPLGISFFTFQAISYTLDVYRREVPAEREFLRFGLYVFLFPHLIAGPIVRYRDLAGSLAKRTCTTEQFASGVRRFIVGLAKKLLLANTLAESADTIFRLPPEQLAPSAAWLGLICYSLQIYFDFSGYSDMAIGLGRMFGFEFAENFNYPYLAQSVTDFWRRWHLSLSTWFRDYLYIPLGGNRGSGLRTGRNLLIVFLLCGLWHGASWTFVVWGGYHGLFLIFERLGFGRILNHLGAPFRHAYLLFVVMLGWVWFRSSSLEQANGFFAALFGLHSGEYQGIDFLQLELLLALGFGVLACFPVLRWLREWSEKVTTPMGRSSLAILELAGLYLCFVAAIIRLAAESYQPFIYFRF
jgi:alginate O-acetyltransferase complex protein AlgI